MTLKYWVDQQNPAEVENYACADCSRSNKANKADVFLVLNGTRYAFCKQCSKEANTSYEYIEWLDRNKPIPVTTTLWASDSRLKYSFGDKLDNHICASCFSDGCTKSATSVFLNDIPMCTSCCEHFDLQETYLTPYERGGLDNYYMELRNCVKNGGCFRLVKN